MNKINKHKKILLVSFVVSALLHTGALICLQRYSVWFSSVPGFSESSNWLSFVDKKGRDEILKSAFATQPKEPQEENSIRHPIVQEPIEQLRLLSPVRLPEPMSFIPLAAQLPSQLTLSPANPSPRFTMPSESFNLLEHLPKDFAIPPPTFTRRLPALPALNPTPIVLKQPPPKSSIPTEPPAPSYTAEEPTALALSEKALLPKPLPPIPLPHLPKIPTLAELETASYSDSFDADLVFLPKEEGKGYLFALTLIPKPDLELPRIKQHIAFLIDRSNSVQQGRLAATKAAIHKALEELYPDDTFNIIAFDSKLEKMSPNDLPCVGKSFAIAEDFLEKIQLGSFFATSDLYKPLFLTVPGQVPSGEIYTAILFTDTEALVKKGAQKALLSDWTRFNRGKVALYAIGQNGDPHLATLDAVTAFNKGKLTSAPTNRGVKRKLLKLLKMIRYPIAKNISCHAISLSPQSKVTLYPKPTQTPHLYLDQPYVILGETENLDDFVLFVQGRLKDKWLNVKKTVSFTQAKKGNKSLRQEWALQRAYQLYEHYIADDDPKHIAEAQALLEPFEFQAAFR